MLTKQKKPFNTSTKILPLSESSIKMYDSIMKTQSSKILTQQDIEKKFTQLYQENQKLKEKKEKMRQQIQQQRQQNQLKDCTFHPKINPQIEAFMSSGTGSFLKRQEDWVSKKEKKIKQLQNQSLKKITAQCSFHPQISKKSLKLIQKNYQSDKKPINSEIREQKFLSTPRSVPGSYRLIHQRKDSYRKLNKTGSFKTFNLMTEKRHLQRLQNESLHKAPCGTESQSVNDSVQEQFSFSSINFPFASQQTVNQPVYDDYIENIVIKTQQQDTFNSLSSLEMRSEKKIENEEVKNQIFEEQGEQESIEHGSLEEGGVNDEQTSHSDENSYNVQEDEYPQSQQDQKISQSSNVEMVNKVEDEKQLDNNQSD